MNSTVKKWASKWAVCLVSCVGGGALLLGALLPTAVTFESLESKTGEGKAIHNEVTLFEEGKKDIWIMRQTHSGPGLAKDEWDRIAIVVDKSARPKSAVFYQLAPGALGWDENATKVEFRAPCYMCHSNGPRVIRPNPQGTTNLNALERIRVALWNVRIARYGRVESKSGQNVGNVPFRFESALDNEVLRLRPCFACHNDSKQGRRILTRQHVATIDFLMKHQLMPPAGVHFRDEDKEKLRQFLRGL